MDIGINIQSADNAKLQVENLKDLLGFIDNTKFGDEVAIRALKTLRESFNQPISISDVRIDSGDTKYYKGSIVNGYDNEDA